MVKIMFVCLGNICRSPMAEYVFKNLVEKRGVAQQFFITSSATSAEEIVGGVGNPIYPLAKQELAKHGIVCNGKRAVQLRKSDYDEYDYIIGMDSYNIRNMLRIFGGDPQGKVHKLMEYTDCDGDVADPWYTRQFDVTYRDISCGCNALLEKILQESETIKFCNM